MVKITYTKPRVHVYTIDETLEYFPLSRDTVHHRWLLIYTCSYNCTCTYCTFFGDVCPLWVGEGVGALTNPLFHTGGDGGTTRTVERREPTQPRGGGMRKDSLCADDRVYTVYVHVHVCAVFSPGPFSIAAPHAFHSPISLMWSQTPPKPRPPVRSSFYPGENPGV